MMAKNERNALLGFLGGVVFMIGDCLLYVYPGRDPALDIDPVFASMPAWRSNVSAFLGFIGMASLVCGKMYLHGNVPERSERHA